MRRVYPSSETPGDTDRAPAPGSVRVSFGAVQTGRAAQIATGKSFRRQWSPSIAARVSIQQEMGYSGLGGARALDRLLRRTNTYTFAAFFCYTPHPLHHGDFRDRRQPSPRPR